jgi:hypothetical protein
VTEPESEQSISSKGRDGVSCISAKACNSDTVHGPERFCASGWSARRIRYGVPNGANLRYFGVPVSVLDFFELMARSVKKLVVFRPSLSCAWLGSVRSVGNRGSGNGVEQGHVQAA